MSHEVYFTIIDKEKLLLYQKNSLISVFERKDAQLSVKNVATFVVIKSIATWFSPPSGTMTSA